jgi:hypothetical protein
MLWPELGVLSLLVQGSQIDDGLVENYGSGVPVCYKATLFF